MKMTAQNMMASYYDKINNRNKKRVDISRPDGSLLKRYFEYGSIEYIAGFYESIRWPKNYTITIYNIGQKLPLYKNTIQ